MNKCMIFLLMICFVMLSGCSAATDTTVSDSQAMIDSIKIDELNKDYLLLKNADIFSDGPVGDTRDMPEEIKALGRLFKLDDAKDYFIKLEATSTNEGKLYALCGLYYSDYDYYNTLMKKYECSDDTVTQMSGCIKQLGMNISELIKIDRPDPDVVRLLDNTDTINAWREKNHVGSSFQMDFYGGGIPFCIKEYADKYIS